MKRKKYSKLLCLLGAAVFIFSAAAGYALALELPFSDVPADAWYLDHLKDAYKLGVAEGYGDGTFRPQQKVSYGEFITMAVFHEKSDAYLNGDYSQSGSYSGMSAHWAAVHYYKAIELGYFNEAQIGIRKLSSPIPRRDMALILAGMIRAAGGGDNGSVVRYDDVAQTDSHEYYISLCSSLGLLEGYGDGTFRPDNTLTRAEAMKVVVEYCRLKASLPESGEDEEKTPDEIIPGDKLAILNHIWDSLELGKDGAGYYFSYSQPDVADKYHLKISCNVYGSLKDDYPQLYSYLNDADWRFVPENYNPAAHSEKQYFKGVSSMEDKAVYIIIRVFESDDFNDYCNYSLYLENDGSARLHKAVSMADGSVVSEDLPLADGVIKW